MRRHKPQYEDTYIVVRGHICRTDSVPEAEEGEEAATVRAIVAVLLQLAKRPKQQQQPRRRRRAGVCGCAWV